MKNLLSLLLIAFSLSVFGQKKDSALTDSTKFLSISDISRYAQKYQDVATYKEYQSFLNLMNLILKDAIAEWNKQTSDFLKPK
jgi:hypothetical protein